MTDPSQWCSGHDDRRIFSHQSTDRGEVVKVYVDEWDPNCQHIVGTGKFVRDGHRPAAV